MCLFTIRSYLVDVCTVASVPRNPIIPCGSSKRTSQVFSHKCTSLSSSVDRWIIWAMQATSSAPPAAKPLPWWTRLKKASCPAGTRGANFLQFGHVLALAVRVDVQPMGGSPENQVPISQTPHPWNGHGIHHLEADLQDRTALKELLHELLLRQQGRVPCANVWANCLPETSRV